MSIDSITNSTIGTVNIGLFNFLIKITNPVIKDVINLVMGRGIDVSWILKDLGLDFIQFEKTLLVPMDGYMLLFVTPIFKLDDIGPKFNQYITSFLEYMASNEVIQAIVNSSYDSTQKKVDEKINDIN